MRLKAPTRSANRVLLVLLALALVRGLVYVSVVPPWQHYDEPGHVENVIEYMVRRGHRPLYDTTDFGLRLEIVASMQQHRFASYQPAWSPPSDRTTLTSPHVVPLPQSHQPPLYYLLAATLLSAVPSQSLEVHLYVLRLMSVALNLVLLLIAAATVRCLLPGRSEIQHGVLLFIIFLPAYSDVATAVNNDVLANLLVTGTLYLLVRQLVDGPSWPLGLATVGIFVLGLATKRTTAVLLLPVLGAILLSSKQRGRKHFWITAAALAAMGLTAGIAVFDWQTGQGVVLSPQVDRYLFHGSFSSFLDSLLDWERTWPVYRVLAPLLFRGFWGHFTWGAEAFSIPVYYLLLMVTLIALAGVIRSLFQGQSNSLGLNHRQKDALWILILTLALVWLTALLRVHPLETTGATYLPRARYTYVAVVSTAVLFVTGLHAWVPSRWRSWPVIGLAVGGILLDAWFLLEYLLPFYLG